MRYMIASQLYWPIWLVFKSYGHSLLGICAGAAFVFVACAVMWRLEFGTWDW
jgi:hypothetical protein